MAPLGEASSTQQQLPSYGQVQEQIMGKLEQEVANLLVLPELADEELGDDDVFVLESIAEAKKNEEDRLRVTLVLGLRDAGQSLAKVLKAVEMNGGVIIHLETRECKEEQQQFQQMPSHLKDQPSPRLDALLRLDIKMGSLMHFLKTMKRCSYLDSANLVSSRAVNVKCKQEILIE